MDNIKASQKKQKKLKRKQDSNSTSITEHNGDIISNTANSVKQKKLKTKKDSNSTSITEQNGDNISNTANSVKQKKLKRKHDSNSTSITEHNRDNILNSADPDSVSNNTGIQSISESNEKYSPSKDGVHHKKKRKLDSKSNNIDKINTESSADVDDQCVSNSSKVCIESAENNTSNNDSKRSDEDAEISEENNNMQLENVIPDEALSTEMNSLLGYEIFSTRSFECLRDQVSPPTMEAIDSFGFTRMTEIQSKSILPLLEGKDLRGTAKTGSGKTLAFLIPAFELLRRLEFRAEHGTGVIVLCPTRELCMQTYGVVRVFAERHKFSHGLCIGGASRKAEAAMLPKGVSIVVGSPGRMLDHLKNTRGFNFSNVVCLVIDEADRMLSIGFEEEMKAILRVLPKRRQTMLFSATRNQKTDDLVAIALKVTLVEVDVSEDATLATVENLTQYYLLCPSEQKFLVLYTFLRRKASKKMMVFFSSYQVVKFYAELLNQIKVPVMCIYGKMKQSQRTDIFYQFNAAKSGMLLCTDIAARGLDIPEVDWIVQFDAPESYEEYIHRVGRTARAGKSGKAVLMLHAEEVAFVRHLQQQKLKLSEMEIQPGKIFNIQEALEKKMNDNYGLQVEGRRAFRSYLFCYMKHKMKDIFDVRTLDFPKVAKSFGFDFQPVIDFKIDLDKMYEGNKRKAKRQRYIKK